MIRAKLLFFSLRIEDKPLLRYFRVYLELPKTIRVPSGYKKYIINL